MITWVNVKMSDDAVIVFEGENACKLLNCFAAYKKLIGASEISEQPTQAEGIKLEFLPAEMVQLVKIRK